MLSRLILIDVVLSFVLRYCDRMLCASPVWNCGLMDNNTHVMSGADCLFALKTIYLMSSACLIVLRCEEVMCLDICM